jgi:hypothetical protein
LNNNYEVTTNMYWRVVFIVLKGKERATGAVVGLMPNLRSIGELGRVRERLLRITPQKSLVVAQVAQVALQGKCRSPASSLHLEDRPVLAQWEAVGS